MKRSFRQNVCAIFAVLILVWLAGGCALTGKKPGQAPAPAQEPTPGPAQGVEQGVPSGPGKGPAVPLPPETTYFLYTVKWPGESLSIIAAWYTGELDNWKVLAQANPNLNPDRIHVGDKIRIPENMMKTRDPLPKDFVGQFVPELKTKEPAAGPAPPAKEEKEPELFGPKQYPKN